MNDAVPAKLRAPLMLSFGAYTEKELLSYLRNIGTGNKVLKSMIGQGYYESILPQVIRRNVLENPMWYTPYTPYQAEISQGHLESLLNFQTMISSLVRMDMANASLLDHATAAAETMYLAYNFHRGKRTKFCVASNAFLSVISVMQTYASPLGIELEVCDLAQCNLADPQLTGVFVQTPDRFGALHNFT
uniref:Glycine dehydrogenase [decarboxylating] n=1 Tax=Lygus hesperus TaxID=30085 RepID=A0A0A9VVT6_LYGHE